jgi:NADH:ubiquinone oxidoreductase subunit 2 (subunit N)
MAAPDFFFLIALINVVVYLYYYLLVSEAAWLPEPKVGALRLSVSLGIQGLSGVSVVVMVVAGSFPNYLMTLAGAAVQLSIES